MSSRIPAPGGALRRGVLLVSCSALVFACGDYWDYWDHVPGGPGDGPVEVPPEEDAFEMRVVTQGLFQPYEITWGPDDMLWISERVGRRLLRLDPNTGDRFPMVLVDDAVQLAGQDGVMGFALHPELLKNTGNDYLYVAYTYDADPGPALDRRAKIRRYTYNATTGALETPVDLLTGLLTGNDHNSGRLVFGPDARLYYTIGDLGGNQFAYKCQPIRSQELPTQSQVDAGDYSAYVGKVLRIELDGSVPADNPVLAGVRSHVFSYGHRNAQGLVFGDGKLYSDEHGPKSDDELNWIRAGKNYGWPNVSGFQDDKAYVYANWSESSPTPCDELEYDDYSIPPSVPIQLETAFSHPALTSPIATFYTVPNDFEFQHPACAGGIEYICWPTIAPGSLDYYPSTGKIPRWGNSLLLPSMKEGKLFRVRLSPDGRRTIGRVTTYFETTNRYRDLAISRDTRTVYIVTDNEGVTQPPTIGVTSELEHRGAVLEFRYVGPE